MKNHTRAQSMLRLSRLSPLLILAAALVALAVFFAHDAPRAQAQTPEVEVWSSNLTVGNLPPNAWRGYTSTLNRGQLSDNDFVYEGVTYVVTNLTDRGNGAVILALNKAIPSSLKQALTLTFRGRQLALADAVAPNAQSVRWNNTRVRFSLDDVINVKLIKPAVPAPPPPPPASTDLTDTNNAWFATLTLQDIGSGSLGCLNDLADSAKKCSTGTTLTDDEFELPDADVSIRAIFLSSLGLDFYPTNTAERDALQAHTLFVDSVPFRFANASNITGTAGLRWASPGLTWSEGDTVQLRLTVQVSLIDPPLPTLTASFSPDEPVRENWETNSAHDLWSPTLTVQDLSTPESAPANRGCDDGDASATCRSALTDRDFRFKGVDYTVIGISYNQRKVAADPNNVFNVTTYEESLTLTLDKAIPESFRSCLTLHSGNAKVPFADDGLDGAGVDVALSASNSTITVTEISGNAWGLNWSAGDAVKLRLPNVGCLTLTLSEPVMEETSMQIGFGGTADNYIPHPNPLRLGADNRQPGTYGDYNYIRVPTFAAGSTTASTPIRPVDDSEAEGCETITMDMTMWPGEYRAIEARYTVAIQDDDGGNACVGGG